MSTLGFDYLDLLEVFLWSMDCLMRPTLGNLLRGYEAFAHDPAYRDLIEALERRRYVRRERRGGAVGFRITETTARRFRDPTPSDGWDRRWDGRWRVVVFDIPESRRRDRQSLWRGLRARKLGMLQRSVWIWPHVLEAQLREILDAEGVPDCFCGLECDRLFLCTAREVVDSAWDWDEISQQQEDYLDDPRLVRSPRQLTRLPMPELLGLARVEREAYREAFSLDPLLPRRLWPRSYLGERVDRRHQEWRKAVARRLAVAAAGS